MLHLVLTPDLQVTVQQRLNVPVLPGGMFGNPNFLFGVSSEVTGSPLPGFGFGHIPGRWK